jgi:hypothetical protein
MRTGICEAIVPSYIGWEFDTIFPTWLKPLPLSEISDKMANHL